MLPWNTTPKDGSSSNNFNLRTPPNDEDNNKLIDYARKGLIQFRKDFIGDDEDEDVEVRVDGGPKKVNGVFLEELGEVAKTFAKFGVDDELFEDPRPIVDFIEKLKGSESGSVQKEFRLFERDDRMTEVMKSIYNVNNMEMAEPWEMCSTRMYPRSIERLPIDVVGMNDFGELRKSMLLPVGNGKCKRKRSGSDPDAGASSSSSPESNEERQERGCCDVAHGLRSLASLMMSREGVEWNPMGFLTFAGMNLNKLMKHLDREEPITPTFAGPFAEHDFCLDYGRVGVSKGYEEYEFLGVEGSEEESDRFLKWKNTIRIKRSTLSLFSFEIIAFIFYTFYGDALQLLAASELYRRGWRYHKVFQVWISPWTGQPDNQLRDYIPPIKTVVDESLMRGWPSGVYVYFHYGRWEFCTKEFKVNDGVLEGRPAGFEDGLWE